MKIFQLATALALTGSATASSTARPSGKYTYHKDAPMTPLGPGTVPTDIAVTFHGETLDAHIAGCTGEGIDGCNSKANFACFDKGFRMDDDKLSVDDLQYVGCLKANLDRNGFQGYEYEMSYNAAEDNIHVMAVAPDAAFPNRTVVLQNTAPRKKASNLRGSAASTAVALATHQGRGLCGHKKVHGKYDPPSPLLVSVTGLPAANSTVVTFSVDAAPVEPYEITWKKTAKGGVDGWTFTGTYSGPAYGQGYTIFTPNDMSFFEGRFDWGGAIPGQPDNSGSCMFTLDATVHSTVA